LPVAARDQITVALSIIDALDIQLAPMDQRLRTFARRQPGCKKLLTQFGVGELTAVTILAELGDARRFSSSSDAVRFAGLDIIVHQSDQRRAPGHLSRQGPPALRWALFEASMCAARRCSPDYDYYSRAAERLGSHRARLSVARKILKRSYHLLRELGDEAIAPI
jgi:transposase